MLDYPSASNAVAVGGCFSFGGGLLLLAAFLSPFWIQSYEATPNSFQNMGLWMYCFKDFRYPYNQFDKLFNGCQFVLSSEYDLIRGWVLPGWLMVVQTLITAALLTSYVGQITLASILIRYPLKFVLRNEWVLSGAVSVCNCIVAIFTLSAVSIYGGQCRRRDWLMYPNSNHLSWSFYLAVISLISHSIGSFFFYLDAKANYARRRESKNLVMQMQPNTQTHHGLQRMNYI